jgi:endothelin-converting enzyme
MMQTIQDEFSSKLPQRDWLSDEVKRVAKEKVDAIYRKMGYPTSPLATDPLALREFYTPLLGNLSSSQPTNALAMAKLTVAKGFAKLGQPVDRGGFMMSITYTNAYYTGSLNAIQVLAGIQQFPVFDPNFPGYLLYGSMGSILGHELTHGFDNVGRHYDPSGNFTVWWDESSIQNFRNRTECFVEQYNNFSLKAPNGTDVAVNGQQTLHENIADAGGVGLSFGAWRRSQQEHPDSQGLPGLEHFTIEQLFFLRWAQTFCSYAPPAAGIEQIVADTHSPAFARILGPLANSRDFRMAYNCPVKEPTCELW